MQARLSRVGWQADCNAYLSINGNQFPPNQAIEALGTAKPFISTAARHDWVLVEVPQVMENITRVEVVKRAGTQYYNRFKVRLEDTRRASQFIV